MRTVSYESVSFAGHETFPFRYAWLPKAARFVRNDPHGFSEADALVRLGVGKNMVRSIRHWALACGVIEQDPRVRDNRGRVLRVSELGEQLLGKHGWDPYLEDPATLWLLHWQLVSTPDRATTWFWVFNQCPQPEFTKDDLLRWLLGVVEQARSARVSEASLKRDVDCFLGTYVGSRPSVSEGNEDVLDCPLTELELIREFGRGSYLLYRHEQQTLPDELFAYALVEFLERSSLGTKTCAADALAYAPGSPGRVFALNEDGLLGRLSRLADLTQGNLTFDETAGLRQLIVHQLPSRTQLLSQYYRRTAEVPPATYQ